MKLSVVVAVFVFCMFSVVMMLHLKTDVSNLYDLRSDLIQKQSDLRELVKVQKAELTYLTSPVRLSVLAEKAGMVPIEGRQISQVGFFYEEGQ